MNLKTLKALIFLLFIAISASAQQGPPPGPPPPLEVRLTQVTSHLDKELALKPDQKQKLSNAYHDFFTAMDKMRSSQPGPPQPGPPGKKEEVDKLVKARDKIIKKALTPAQFKKYIQIEKTMRPGGGRPGGPPPPPPGS